MAPTLENRMFAGWYADAACTEVYTAMTGYAYAKFVPAIQPVRLTGCSLRNDGQGADKTTLRFCYEFTVPQGTTRVRASWHYENARTGDSGDAPMRIECEGNVIATSGQTPDPDTDIDVGDSN